MSNDNAFNGKLGVNMVLDSTPYTGPRVHAKENPRVSDLSDRLRLKSGTRQFLITEETALEAADALEAKDRIIAELVEALEPFAEQADRYDPPENDSGYVAWNSPFYIGDLRGARSAILRAKEQE